METKFRAWVKRTSQMIYFSNAATCSEYNTLTFAWVENGEEIQPFWSGSRGKQFPFEWDDELELMFFTGLLDKNGKEIYEGDLLEESPYANIEIKFHHTVEWDDYHCGFKPFCIPDLPDGGRDVDPEVCEVIGNIYEKKEG